MKKIIFSLLLFCAILNSHSQTYIPTASNIAARQSFKDDRFGLFIHWGLFSILGDGEWVLNNRNIPFANYQLLEKTFNPVDFDANKWVSIAKKAGMKYITLVTRHHDGFSLWDTKYSDFNIMHSPYKKDIVKQVADACHAQGMKLFLYYSLLDWGRTDYAYWSGRTGKGTGRKEKGNWENYVQFMKNQLTELLTNYGKIDGIWFDGYWDQLGNGKLHSDSHVDWHMGEIYQLIHQLQPQCLAGNNHHLAPLAGEDFQMFERDVPGENTHGFSGSGAISDALPLETCSTINDGWGYNIKDDKYKSFNTLIKLLVKSTGLNANLLLNIGPLPNGEIQPQFVSRLDSMGNWLKIYGESIYGTNGGYLRTQPWGNITQTDKKMYLHVLSDTATTIELPNFPFKKIKSAYLLKNGLKISVQQKDRIAKVRLPLLADGEPDHVVVLDVASPF